MCDRNLRRGWNVERPVVCTSGAENIITLSLARQTAGTNSAVSLHWPWTQPCSYSWFALTPQSILCLKANKSMFSIRILFYSVSSGCIRGLGKVYMHLMQEEFSLWGFVSMQTWLHAPDNSTLPPLMQDLNVIFVLANNSPQHLREQTSSCAQQLEVDNVNPNAPNLRHLSLWNQIRAHLSFCAIKRGPHGWELELRSLHAL